jgi:hypothetical protein
LRRGDDGAWPSGPLAIIDGKFALSSIGLSLPVAVSYRGTGITG